MRNLLERCRRVGLVLAGLLAMASVAGPARAGRVSAETAVEPAPTAPVYGAFSTNTSYGVPLLMRQSSAGSLKMVYLGTNGAQNWGTEFYTDCSLSAAASPAFTVNDASWANTSIWGVAAASTLLSTAAGNWTIQAIGDVNGDGAKELVCRSAATVQAQATTKSQIRVLFFADDGTLRQSQPAPFYQKTPWVIEGLGLFHTNNQTALGVASNAEQLVLRHSTAGSLKLIQFQTNGMQAWGNQFLTAGSLANASSPAFTNTPASWTNTALWGEAAASNLLSPSSARWTLDAIGDVNGDQKKELIMRSRDTLSSGDTTQSQIRVLFYAADGASLRDSQPPPFYEATPWVIQGCGHFTAVDLTGNGVASNADQLLMRQSSQGSYKVLYFQTNGVKAWGTAFLTNSSFTAANDGVFTNNLATWTNTALWGAPAQAGLISTNAANWVCQAIGDVNRDGRDEVILRSTSTVAAQATTKSQIRVLFFAEDGSKLSSAQPPPFYQKTPWVIEGLTPNNFVPAPVDTTPPADVSGFTATPWDGQVALAWQNPGDADFAGVRIQRQTGGYPAGVNDGVTVYSGTESNAVDFGLTNGTAYYYKAFSCDEVPNYAGGATATATPRVTSYSGGMALIPAGSNSGVNPLLEGARYQDYYYPSNYSLTVSAFYMDRYEVTKAQWDEVYTWAITNGYSFDNTGSGKAADHPVHNVNWYDSVKWCNARSQKEGRTAAYYTTSAKTEVYKSGQIDLGDDCVDWSSGYRLPTDEEWEYAARGGAASKRFPWGGDTIDHDKANYYSYRSLAYDTGYAGYDTRYYGTSPVGAFEAGKNAYGLYDMAGNVWEWCYDWYPVAVGSDRVIRGGGWSDGAFNCRVGYRYGSTPGYAGNLLGFRAALPPGQ